MRATGDRHAGDTEMNPKKAVKEAEKQLRKDSESLVLRLKLAAAYREVGRTREAVELYRSVAVAYHAQGRLVQAIAVCKSVLEIEPGQTETQALLTELDRMRAQAREAPDGQEAPQAGARPHFFEPEVAVERPPDPEPAPVAVRPPPVPGSSRGDRRVAPEFGERSGLTPHSDPELRPFGAPAAARPQHRLDEASRLRERNRTTERMDGPPERRSVPLFTPTPLPEPLALHDLDDSRATPLPRLRMPRSTLQGPPVARPPGTPTVPHPAQYEDDAPTRIAGEPHDDDAQTRIAGDPHDDGARSRIAGDAHEGLGDDALTTVAPEVLEEVEEVEEVEGGHDTPPPSQHEDEALTTIAGEGGWAPPGPAAPQPSYFERETRRIDLAGELGGTGYPDSAYLEGEDEPTDLPDRSASGRPGMPREAAAGPGERMRGRRATTGDDEELTIPPELQQFQRGARLLDVEATFADEPTDPRDEDAELTNPGPSTRSEPAAPAPLETGAVSGFQRPFSDTIQSLGPDGSTIEAPLSLFREMPRDALDEMARRMTLRHYQPGDLVLREGDPGDACYVIAAGEVRVMKRDPEDAAAGLIEVARLGDGALFGEFALLADRRRHATVQAVGSADIYEIPRRLLRELAASFPAVGPLLERFYRERLLSTLLTTAPFFKPMPEERRGELLARFRPVRSESGDVIVRERERAGGLYLIVLGSVEITKRMGERRSVLLATLGEGAYFGEMSLLTGGVASASVTAIGPTELAVLPPKDFYDLIADNPVLWAEVKREASRRELMTNQIVAGETSIV